MDKNVLIELKDSISKLKEFHGNKDLFLEGRC